MRDVLKPPLVLCVAGLLVAAGHAAISRPAGPARQAPSAQPSGTPHPEVPDTEGETCRGCHDDLVKGDVVHAPVAAAMCTGCHVIAGSGDGTTVELAAGRRGDTAPLCSTCHDDVAAQLKAPHVHGPAATGDCLGCHVPHASAYPKLLQAGGIDACLACHGDVADDLKRKVAHAPAAGACVVCHTPHGGPNAFQLREPVNALCLGCHTAPPAEAAAAPVRTLFGRELSAAEASLAVGPSIPLDALRRRGHPVTSHPVVGPRDPNDEARPFGCVSCHAPHGSDGPSLKRFGGDDPTSFCIRCHK